MTNGIDFIVSFYALLKLGACINPFNFRLSLPELIAVQAEVSCDIIITSPSFAALLEPERTNTNNVKLILTEPMGAYPNLSSFLSNGHDLWEFYEDMAEKDVIFNIFTGGTTGTPKAASHTHQGTLVRVIGYLLDQRTGSPDDVYLNYAPLFHIGGIAGMLRMLSMGATFCLLDSFDPDEIAKTIRAEKVTQMSLIPPTILNRFDQLPPENTPDLSSVRILQLAGGACDEGTLELAFKLMPNVLCVNSLGSSENTAYISNVFGKEDFLANRKIYLALGKPQIFYDTKLIKEDGSAAAIGETGELYGKGMALMAGYYGKSNCFTSDGWFPSGDILSKSTDGNYYFCSRCKDMIKSGGENIYAVEVENAIRSGNEEKISECAVFGLPDKQWGEVVAAAVVLRPGVEMTADDIICHCRKRIASFKKPREVFFLNELPHSSLGKVQKSVLREMLMIKS